MNVLILAAGYATRLYPLTLSKAKPLLEVAGKPMIEWVLDNLASVSDLETIYIVTNNKFAKNFQTWAEAYKRRHSQFQFKIINECLILFIRIPEINNQLTCGICIFG